MLPASILIPRRVDFFRVWSFCVIAEQRLHTFLPWERRPCFFLTPAGANYFPKRITPDRFRNISAGFLKRKGNNDGLSRRQGQKHKCRGQTFCLFGQGLLRFFFVVVFLWAPVITNQSQEMSCFEGKWFFAAVLHPHRLIKKNWVQLWKTPKIGQNPASNNWFNPKCQTSCVFSGEVYSW